jgi:hypothetical protein
MTIDPMAKLALVQVAGAPGTCLALFRLPHLPDGVDSSLVDACRDVVPDTAFGILCAQAGSG